MSLLISYDIEDNYLRKKAVDFIIDSGFARVQYSVYIGTVNEAVTQAVIKWLHTLPDNSNWGEKDSVMILSLTPLQIKQIMVIGDPKWDKDDLSGDRHTLIL